MITTTARKYHPQIQRCVNYFKYKVFRYTGDVYCWVAGGALRGFFEDGYVKSDIDLWFRNEDDLVGATKSIQKNTDAEKVYESDRVLRLTSSKTKFDLVKRYYNSMEECISQFDFTVCCCAVDHEDVKHHEDYFIDMATKRLIINNIIMPLSTLRRVQKYTRRGYRICDGGLLTISKSLAEIDYEDPEENFFEFYPDGEARILSID